MSCRMTHNGFRTLQMKRTCAGLLLCAMVVSVANVAVSQPLSGQNPQQSSGNSPSTLPDAPGPEAANSPAAGDAEKKPVTLRNVPLKILEDQGAIWSSPVRIRDRNLAYLVPLVLTTTVLITTDHQVMSSHRLDDPSLNNHASTASNALLGGFVAWPVSIYGLGHIQHNDHATETGLLAGEAMVDSLVVDEAMKAITMRERPTLNDAKGKFFQSNVGLDSSFPSTHSMIAWSSAAVIASEYNGAMTKLTAYGLASGLSLARVLARQHFPSDVLVGSAIGWLVGRYVFHKHSRFYYHFNLQWQSASLSAD